MAGTEYKISDEAVRVAASASRAARGGISGHNDTQRPRRNEQTFDLSISTMTSTSTFGCVAMNAAPSNARGISDSIALSNDQVFSSIDLSNHQVSSSENMGSYYPLPNSSSKAGAFSEECSGGYLCAVYERERERREREGGREGERELFIRKCVCVRERENGI